MSKQLTTPEVLENAVHSMTGDTPLTLAIRVSCLDDLAKEIATQRGKLVAEAKKALDDSQKTLQQLSGKKAKGRPQGSKNKPKADGVAA